MRPRESQNAKESLTLPLEEQKEASRGGGLSLKTGTLGRRLAAGSPEEGQREAFWAKAAETLRHERAWCVQQTEVFRIART